MFKVNNKDTRTTPMAKKQKMIFYQIKLSLSLSLAEIYKIV